MWQNFVVNWWNSKIKLNPYIPQNKPGKCHMKNINISKINFTIAIIYSKIFKSNTSISQESLDTNGKTKENWPDILYINMQMRCNKDK